MDLDFAQSDMPFSMYNAILKTDLAQVRALLLNGCSPDIILNSHSLLTPLIFATIRGKKEILKLLLRWRANVNCKDKYYRTPLMYACVHNNLAILSYLLKAGADVKARDDNGKTALLIAAQLGSIDCLQELANHPDVNLLDVNSDGKSVVTFAALRDDSHCLKVLLNLPCVIRIVDKDGNSPLLAALHLSRLENALVLLDYGVDVNIMNKEGKTPLTKAFEQINKNAMKQVVSKLLLCGAKPSFSLVDEYFMHEMIARGENEIVQGMIMNGCAPRLRDCKEHFLKFDIGDKISPFAVALLSNKPGIAKYLLANMFLTKFDIYEISRIPTIMNHLMKKRFVHCVSLLEDFSAKPLPLVALSFTTVLSLYADCANETLRETITDKLPPKLSNKLLYQTEYASLCPHEWDTIPFMLKSEKKCPHIRNLSTFWPVGHRVTECPFPMCCVKKGYKIVREIDENLSLNDLSI